MAPPDPNVQLTAPPDPELQLTPPMSTTILVDVPKVVRALASILERVADRNDAAAAAPLPPSVFQGEAKPAISIKAYLDRIARYAGCSPACFVAAYIYLDRILDSKKKKKKNDCWIVLHSLTVHRLLITSVLLAVKFFDDIYYNNAYYAKVGGISIAEMNFLEVEFLFGLRFELNITPAVFNSYCSVLHGEMLLETPAPFPRLHCLLLEEESNSNCQKTRVAV